MKSLGFFKPNFFLKIGSVPLPSKTVQADARVLQRSLLFLFVHWFNEGCSLEGGEIGEVVRSVGKITRETIRISSSSILGFFFVSLK